MSDRRCPFCGERVPTFSLNCPRCYRAIPMENRAKEERNDGYTIIDDDRAPSLHRVDRRMVLILALIPAVFGLFGLGQIYQKDYRKGFTFMLVGVSMMALMVSLYTYVGGGLAFVLIVGLLILFIGGYIVQAFDAFVRSLFTF